MTQVYTTCWNHGKKQKIRDETEQSNALTATTLPLVTFQLLKKNSKFKKCSVLVSAYAVECSWSELSGSLAHGYPQEAKGPRLHLPDCFLFRDIKSERCYLRSASSSPLQLCCRWVGSLWGHYPWPSLTLFPFFPGDRLLFRLPTLLSIWSAVSHGLWMSMIKLPVFYLLSARLPLWNLPGFQDLKLPLFLFHFSGSLSAFIFLSSRHFQATGSTLYPHLLPLLSPAM